jgi:hypothetical protein
MFFYVTNAKILYALLPVQNPQNLRKQKTAVFVRLLSAI